MMRSSPMDTKMILKNKETGAEKEVDVTVDRDDCNRPETTLEGLSSLNPVFNPESGSVTALETLRNYQMELRLL